MRYEHTQFGTLVVIVIGAILLVEIVLVALLALRWPFLIVLVLMGLLMLAFHSLTVSVDSHQLRVRFGWGPIGKAYPVAEIRDARAVKNKWYYGWGIRLTPHGWLFNISGDDAVEVEFASGKKVRIGTDEPRKLLRAIRRAASLDQPC
jgi:hypothetical protein